MAEGMHPFKRILTALEGNEPDQVPVCLWLVSQNYPYYLGIPEVEYFRDVKKMLKCQVHFHRLFPNVFSLPGPWPAFGVVPTASAFGAEVSFPDNTTPWISKTVDIDEALSKNPDPVHDGYSAKVLGYMKYFKEHLPKDIAESFHPLEGRLKISGAVEDAALAIGYDKFLIGLRMYPEKIHDLLNQIASYEIEYGRALEEVVGPADIVVMTDHSAGFVQSDFFLEFMAPIYSRIFKAFPRAKIRLYHNESDLSHLLDDLKMIEGANVWHCGPKADLTETKKRTDLTLMGNIDPVDIILRGTPVDIEIACKRAIIDGASGGSFWLSSGGGMAPKSPLENIQQLVRSAEKYGKYPIGNFSSC